MEILEKLIKLETKLHSHSVRGSKEKLELLLADDYIEIGVSGKLYDKKETIIMLTTSEPHEIKATDFYLSELSAEMMQLIYRTEHRKNSQVIRNTIRSSLWKNNGINWRIIFHQGTIEKQ